MDLKEGVVYFKDKPIPLETGEIGTHSTPLVVGNAIIVQSAMAASDTGVQVPTWPGTTQERQVAVQLLSQQTPSVHVSPDAHVEVVVHFTPTFTSRYSASVVSLKGRPARESEAV